MKAIKKSLLTMILFSPSLVFCSQQISNRKHTNSKFTNEKPFLKSSILDEREQKSDESEENINSNVSWNQDEEKNKDIYGILVDVSGSMEEALECKDQNLRKDYVNRAHAVLDSIFKTVSQNEKNKYQSSFACFALAFGLSKKEYQHCDLFTLFDFMLSSYDTKESCEKLLNKYGITDTHRYIDIDKKNPNKCKIIGHRPLIELAKRNGAPYVGEYIEKHLNKEDSGHLFKQFVRRPDLLSIMIEKLPIRCKNKEAYDEVHDTKELVKNGKIGSIIIGGVLLGFSIFPPLAPVAPIGLGLLAGGVGTQAGEITRDSVEKKSARKALIEAKDLVLGPIYKLDKFPRTYDEIKQIIDRLSIIYPFEPKNINFNDNNDKKNDNTWKVDELLEDIRPHIYGRTPMCQSLKNAQHIFEIHGDGNEKRRLLIISDGESTDGDPIPIAKTLRENKNVIISCCYITNKNINNPKQLYYNKMNNWDKGGKNLCQMASLIPNDDPALSLFLDEGWRLAPEGKSKLFVQANHPDIIEQFCQFIKHIGTSNDAIINMVGKYNFDQVINNKINNENAPHQEGGTCYANAVAMGLHLAMSRIHRRHGGCPSFEELREKIIKKYGTDGGNTEKVLNDFCSQYRLHAKSVDYDDLRSILSKRRILVSSFRLSEEGWDNFCSFFDKNKKGILTEEEILKKSGDTYFKMLKTKKIFKGRYENKEKKNVIIKDSKGNTNKYSSSEVKEIDGHSIDGGGHAVTLVRCEPNCLVFMNSWGIKWGDNGFFRVGYKGIQKMKFYDIYWTLNDLLISEKKAYKEYCNKKTKVIKENIPLSLLNLDYKCPKCDSYSQIKEYSGNFLEAECPKCKKFFKPNGLGLIRSLYNRQLRSEV